MSGKSGADGDVRGFKVSDFTDHNDIGVLAHYMTKPFCESEADLGIDMNLIDPVHLIFDRILDRDDLAVGDIDSLESTIKCCALTAACGSGDEENTVRFGRHLTHFFVKVVGESQSAKVNQRGIRPVENTHDDAFSVHRRQRRNAKVDFFSQHLELDASILRKPPLSNIEFGHQLDARNDRGSQRIRRSVHILQHAIHAVAQTQLLLKGLDMNVARTRLNRPGNDEIDQPNDGYFGSQISQMLDVFLIAAKCVAERLDQLFTIARFIAVQTLEPLLDFGLRRHENTQLKTRPQVHRVLRFHIERVSHHQRENVIFNVNGYHM